MPSSRRRAIAVVAAVALVATAGGLWVWVNRPAEDVLTPGWTAVAAVLGGDGVAGSADGLAGRARLADPFGVAAAPDGSVYVADAGPLPRIRRVAPDGSISTLAGGGAGFADGTGDAARFSTPSGLALDSGGALLVADTGNHAIRRVGPDGTVSTVAGALTPGFRDGSGREALFNGPLAVAANGAGSIIVADTYNDRIRAVHPDGSVVTLAGSGARGFVDGAAPDAAFDTPSGVAVDAAANVFVADTGNNAVRAISPDGTVTTIGPPPPEGLWRPVGIAVSQDGFVYATDDRGRIVEIQPGVRARILAGSRPGFADGSGEHARFRAPAGLAFVRPGVLAVADSRNALTRLVGAPSRIGLRAPSSPRIAPGFDAEGFGSKPLLWPLGPMEGPYEVTGTLGEIRGGEGSERFHAGLDVHAPQGAPVRVVRAGVVSAPIAANDFGSLNESVRIGAITYVHLRVGRDVKGEILDDGRFVGNYDADGRLTGIRIRRGASFSTGEVIGSANQFNHVHMNVGWPGEEHNPLKFGLVQFTDRVPPTIARGGVRLLREDGTPAERERGRWILAGRAQIVVDAWDQSDGNARRRRLGLYSLGYQVLRPDGSPADGFEAPLETIRFDRLASDDGAARLVYATGSGIPFFAGRSTRFLYMVSNTFREGQASRGFLDAGALPPGRYVLRIVAADIEGNQAVANRDVPIEVRAPAGGE